MKTEQEIRAVSFEKEPCIKKALILVACECSGTVRDAFTKLGYHAVSCDMLPSETPGEHIRDDVLNHLNDGWDMMIAHPPCTHLSVSGARHFIHKQKEQQEALDFVRKLMEAPIPRIAIENPIGVISTKIQKPTQIIQPYWFGDKVQKTTCLWLKNLPELIPTNMVEPEIITLKNGEQMSKFYYDTFKLPQSVRGHVRSKTFPGIAAAMADQWGASLMHVSEEEKCVEISPSDLALLKQGLRLKINIWHSGHDEQTEALLKKLESLA